MSQRICHVVFATARKIFFGCFMEIFSFRTYSGNLCLHSTQICQVHTNKCASLFNFIESCFLQSNNTLLVDTENIYIFFCRNDIRFPSRRFVKEVRCKNMFSRINIPNKKRISVYGRLGKKVKLFS